MIGKGVGNMIWGLMVYGFLMSTTSINGAIGTAHCVKPPWRQPRGKWMVSLVNSHTTATSKR